MVQTPWERICVFCGRRALADAVLNVLLFLPMGWVVGRRKGTVRAVVVGAAISMGVESVQLLLVGRYTSVTDVLANTVGAWLGGWASNRARVPAAHAAGASVFALLVPAVLLAPDPPEGVYYGQWTAVFGNMESYEGRVLDAAVGEVSVPSQRSPHTAEIRRALVRGEAVRVRFEVGPPPSAPAPIFSVFDERRREIFMLGVDGNDLFVRLWRRGTTMRLETPWWWWGAGLEGKVLGDTIRIAYELGDRSPCLTIQGRKRCLTATSSIGSWSLLGPGGRADRTPGVTSLIWALFLGIPLGMVHIPILRRMLLVLILAGGLVGLSSLLPWWPTPWWGIPVWMLGAGLGVVMRDPLTRGLAAPVPADLAGKGGVQREGGRTRRRRPE